MILLPQVEQVLRYWRRLAQPSHFRRGEAFLAPLSACVTAEQGDACVAPTQENLGPPKEKPGAVTARASAGFGIARKDAFSYLSPVTLSRDFSDFRALDAGLAQRQDGARQRTGAEP
jgi:hypothetical protein